jgi:hypothetical protein
MPRTRLNATLNAKALAGVFFATVVMKGLGWLPARL